MGMVGYFKRIPETLLAALKEDPSAIESMVVADVSGIPAITEEMLKTMPPEIAKSMADMMKVLDEQKAGVAGRIPSGGDIPALSVDKEWHAIHYLLTGDSEGGEGVLAMVVLGGKEIGEDLGYGPARYLTASEVREAYRALAEISREELEHRFDPTDMTNRNIYPGHWENEYFEGLRQAFDDLVSYYRDAASEGHAMLIYLA